jgi:protein SCO1
MVGALLAVLGPGLGCRQAPSPWNATDITGFLPDLSFTLTDGQGRAVTAADFRGRPCLLYFGFTHCTDVCPTTLATLAAADRELGPEADQVRVLFVSVDPHRDSPGVLAHYAARFGPQVVGLTGDLPALRALARRYRVAFGYGEPYPDGDYEVSHSAAIFAFDRAGRARLLMREESGVPALAADLRRLLGE